MNNFKGLTFLVSGCTSGIGKLTCKSLLNLDAKVIGLGRNSSGILDVINDFSRDFQFVSLDLTDKTKLKRLFDENI